MWQGKAKYLRNKVNFIITINVLEFDVQCTCTFPSGPDQYLCMYYVQLKMTGWAIAV